ncbi:MAG: zinc metallopeptidase [Chloroflexota bacterium]
MFLWLLFMIPGILFALFAQWKVSSTYRKYSQIANMRGMTGLDTARVLMQNEGIDIGVEQIPGDLTDHYDPRAKVMRLSAGSSERPSVASMAIVAHELGHAVQDKQGYLWLQLRGSIVGVAGFGSNFGWILIFVGLLMGAMQVGSFGWTIAWVGVVLMAAAVAFSLITLPVEFNASSRAREMLMRNGLVTNEEAKGVNAMLSAAALTYVAGAAQAVLQLLYWVLVLTGVQRD